MRPVAVVVVDELVVKGTKISIRRLIRSNVRRCAASSHHGRKDVGVRSSVPRFLHPVAPRVGIRLRRKYKIPDHCLNRVFGHYALGTVTPPQLSGAPSCSILMSG